MANETGTPASAIREEAQHHLTAWLNDMEEIGIANLRPEERLLRFEVERFLFPANDIFKPENIERTKRDYLGAEDTAGAETARYLTEQLGLPVTTDDGLTFQLDVAATRNDMVEAANILYSYGHFRYVLESSSYVDRTVTVRTA